MAILNVNVNAYKIVHVNEKLAIKNKVLSRVQLVLERRTVFSLETEGKDKRM